MLKRLMCKIMGHQWKLYTPGQNDNEWTHQLYKLGYRRYQCKRCGYTEIRFIEEDGNEKRTFNN